VDFGQFAAELTAIHAPALGTPSVFYRRSAAPLTTDAAVPVVGAETSGDAETAIDSLDDGLWVDLGSDHTDRKSESSAAAFQKQLCPKPVVAAL
jgi:hypothetical protein